ncbi:hypothetical protein F0562_011259 [Nyssa sinensis]|uniref:F-box domain-containing protein n=1 Tax=Nyssa sinensis TaxID=561372 RepID=A0A5J5A494_9ASTE|nr:hypothetical protein F0562_011259 [Nyssa sinensis]
MGLPETFSKMFILATSLCSWKSGFVGNPQVPPFKTVLELVRKRVMDLACEQQSKKLKCKLEDVQPRDGMKNLPRDIALDILSRLPITSLLQFRFVCRSWRFLSQDPDLVKLHFSRTAKNNPCLIFHCDYPIRNQLYFVDFSDQDDNQTVRKIDTPICAAMPEFYVVGSCNGLLCLYNSLYNDPVYIYNPFTRDYKRLPESRLQFQEKEVLFGFGFHPNSREYKVVKIVYSSRSWRRSRSEVQIFSLGSSTTWRSIGKVVYRLERSEALVNGRLHWVTRPVRLRRIVSFDLADEKFEEVPKPSCGGLNRCNYHLAVLGGCLSAVVYCNYGKLEIWVMKDYNVKESWVKEFKIGAYSPKFLEQNLVQSYGIWNNTLNGKLARVLCLLKNGNVLIEYKGGVLVSYDPGSGKFKNLVFKGMPNMFQTFVHVGSLNWIDTPIDIDM